MMKMKKYMILPVLALIFTFVLAAVNPIFAADDEIISGGNTETTLPPTSGTSGNGLIPNLVVSKFSFGGDQVYAGKAFTLSFHLKNTSKTFTVQNVVVKVNGGEIYGLNRDTDTLYFERIKANGTVECSADFISSAESAEGSYPITVTVSYEYYDDGAKCSNASEIKIAVPLAQEERVSINKAAMGSEDYPVYAGEESPVDYEFLNRGFSKLLNTEVFLYDNDSGELLDNAYIGTINASAQMSSSSHLYSTFEDAGEKHLRFVIRYEDAHGNQKEAASEFTVNVQEAQVSDEEMAAVADDSGGGVLPIAFIFIGIIAVVTLGIVIFVRRRRKKKAAQEESFWDENDWDDDSDLVEEDDNEDQ